jgi:FkbM family methyltransferase
LAKRVGRHGRVFAFEPVPKNIELEANRLTTVRLLEAAASNASGDAVIRMTENLSTSSLVWHRKNPSSKELIIKTVVIDHLVEAGEIPRPSFVKIDAEGAEGLVLQGMRNTIVAAKPVLFIECSEIGGRSLGTCSGNQDTDANRRSLASGSIHLRTTGIPILCGCRQNNHSSFRACVRDRRCAKNGPHRNYDFCGQLTCPPLL